MMMMMMEVRGGSKDIFFRVPLETKLLLSLLPLDAFRFLEGVFVVVRRRVLFVVVVETIVVIIILVDDDDDDEIVAVILFCCVSLLLLLLFGIRRVSQRQIEMTDRE